MTENYERPKKYVAGPNDPALPPQLSDFQGKTTDEVLEELNRMPFFMTKLDDSDGAGGENIELEALKALAYEGEPHEIAENFKKQGNALYKHKKYKDARGLYTKGIEIECGNSNINESLFANRAACELEIRNYGRCLTDCKAALQFNPKNLKCYYRMGRAFIALKKLREAEGVVGFGLTFDPENKSLLSLQEVISKKEHEIKEAEEKKQEEIKRGENLKIILDNAVKLRNIEIVNTKEPAELVRETKFRLEDPMDFESQLIFPALVLYPTTDEFDFVGEVSELTSISELLQLVMERPANWFELQGHEDFSVKKLVAYMEVKDGGLVKIGKKVIIHDLLKMEKPNVPLFDNALKIYFVPKSESEKWLSNWSKQKALDRRISNISGSSSL
ncbi:hypothetical protein HG535_0C01290 [Zygotorulaspora mrakii]|uniref:Cns1/TTC4 wheel domain-containing protein n=1 Tax=Zygotorulaspora mrakii TaxID=42260 RepID=A0A7H9AZD6_ZYGMR|nr:uncharacterized protein HG535_0C01290 [Zygotorulaspora mrakii]QLG71780.1 hypothetical protein HG535_0C01290 [Zygotorulaspora mrakii]